MPPKKGKSLEEPSKASKGSKAAPKSKTAKATKAPKAPKAPKTPAPAPAVQAPEEQAPVAARPLNPERDVRRRTRANPSPGLSERKAIDKEPSFTKKRSTIRRTAVKNAAASRDQDAEESTRTETPSASHSPELEESRSTSPELAPQPPSISRTPGPFATDSSSHQAAESSKKSARGTKRTRTQVDNSSDADTEDVSTERRAKRPRGDDQPFEHYSPIAALNSNTQVSDNTVQATPQTVTIEHTEATPQTPTRVEGNVGEQRPASSLSVTINDTSTYFTPQAAQAEAVLKAVPEHRGSEIGAGEQSLSLAVTPSIQGPADATASFSKSAAKSAAKPPSMPAPMTARRTLTMGPDHEHEAMMESLGRRQKQRPLPKSLLSRKSKPVEEVERLHFSDASDSEDLEPLDAEGLRTVKENAKFTLANLAAEKQGKPKPYVWGPNPALEKKKYRKRSDAHTAAPTQHPNETKDADDIEAACKLLIMSKRLAAASAVPSTDNNQVMVGQSSAGPSAASAQDMTPGDDLALESQTPSASQAAGWSLMSTVKSVVSKPFEFFGGASQHAGPSNADNQSGSPSKIPNTPTPAGRLRRGDPLKRRAVLNKSKGKAPAVPLSKVNEFEEHSQNSRGKQRESMLESTADDDLPHHTQPVPVDLYKQPQRIRRRDKAYYDRKYAVPPIDSATGNYVTPRTFYAVPYPPSSDEESSSDEDFETGLPKGPRLYVMQVDKTEKERLETVREEKERLEREAEEEKKRLAEETRLEKERLELEQIEEEDYLNWMPMDLDDLYKANPKWWLFKKHRYSELRMARRYEMNRSLQGQAYPSDKMKRYLAIYHERSGTVGAFTSGKEILTWEERVERQKHLPPPPPPPPKPPGYIREPKVFGSEKMIKWQAERMAQIKAEIHREKCYGCEECNPSQAKDTSEKEKDASDSGASASSANANGEANVSDKEKEVIDKDVVDATQLNTTSEKEKNAVESSASALPATVNGEANVIEPEKELVTKPSDMQSFFDMARGKTPAKNAAPEAQTTTTNTTQQTPTHALNTAPEAQTPITNAAQQARTPAFSAAPETQTPTTIHAHEAQTPAFDDAQQIQTPTFNHAQQAQLEAIRQQVLKHQPQVPSKLGMSPLFQSPLQSNPLQPSPLQYTSSQPNPLQEIQPNQRRRSRTQYGGLMANQDGFTHDNDNSEVDDMPEVDPNEQDFKILPEVRDVPPREVE
ncbi:hypothetical protein DL98DRAFT_206518 [Cadophora sp. DSE1049]|nr:hypothetical protein DL98DRAFT_206518 [Cadophora sp. DSE1049]